MFLVVFTNADFIWIALTVVLTYINAVVSGAEVALFSLTQDDIAELHTDTSPRAHRISNLLKRPDRLSSALFITYILLNITVAALIFYLLFTSSIYFTTIMGQIVAVVIAATYILLFMEFLPKIIASQKPMKFVHRNYWLVQLIYKLQFPFSVLLTKTTDVFSKYSIEKKYDISFEDLSTALELTSASAPSMEEKDMLEGIIRFRDKTVENIMVSRSDMVAIDIETQFSEVIRFIIAAGFSRIPVFEENPDNIKGILYVKDLLPHIDKIDNFRWQSLIRPAYFVPGTKRIDDLLEEFRANKNHMAIIVDEYGGTSGIVTMEDILEEIVGDISDEYDEEESPLYTLQPDGTYIFDGKTSLEDFVEITGVPKKDFEKIEEEADTIAGLILELRGDFPKIKEKIEFKGYGFKVEEMNDRRIIKVMFTPKPSSVAEK